MVVAPFYLVVLFVTALVLSFRCVLCQTGAIELDSKSDDSDLQTFIRRLEHLEARDLEHERENNMLRHQLMSYRKELVEHKTKNDALVDRISAIEVDNKELRNRLNDVKIAIETVCGNINISNDDHTELQSIFSSIKKLNDYVSRNKRAENEGTVAFYTTLTNNLSHLGVNQNIVFDDVITNLGNGYNVHVGDFRVPADGTYVFSTTLTTYANHTNHYRFTKNGITVGHLFNKGAESPFTSASLTTVLQLKLGDTIAVKNVEADEYLYGQSFTAFSGFLLQQDFPSPAIVG